MNTKLLTDRALAVIEQYSNFHIGSGTTLSGICSVPYFNNRRAGLRAGLRALKGKGSPHDIYEEAEITALKEKIVPSSFTGAALKEFMVDHRLGIDCSGLVYYVLNAESIGRSKGQIDRHLSFPYCKKGIIGKIVCRIRPTENTNVQTFASDKNSSVVTLADIQPGDFISMIKHPDASEEDRARDHIILIHQIEYQNFIPTAIHYTHSIAWPTDGVYGHGIRQGVINITDPKKALLEQRWVEAGKTGEENFTFTRAKKSITEIRRLNWFV
ncbi:MAG: hypothetical protein JWO73_719 [Candidatus Taylorbacteria bacterium]|nr:hypothetical protein [Candidatus Taylorbacteria bacterium]